MNDTPRTEAQVYVLDAPLTGYASYPDSKEVVPAEFARELERQLSLCRATLATYTAELSNSLRAQQESERLHDAALRLIANHIKSERALMEQLATVERDARQIGLANVGLMRDAARLDWLLEKQQRFPIMRDDETFIVQEFVGHTTGRGKTKRAAIDAAMKPEPPVSRA